MATWTTLHDVAYLYYFLAADTDKVLEEAELGEMLSRLQQQAPTRTRDDLERIVLEAARVAGTHPPERPVHAVIESLKYAAIPDAQRHDIFNGLVHIARADGDIHINEFAFLRALAKVWNVSLPE